MTNVGDYLLGQGRPDDIALIDGAQAHTYHDLRRAVATQVRQMTEWDLPLGSRVALLAPNSLYWVASYLAAMYAGHTAVPMPPTLTPEDVAKKLQHVECDSVLLDKKLTRRFASVLAAVPRAGTSDTMVEQLQSDNDITLPPPRPAAAEAVLVFTSGTTSAPRAVRVGHDNIRANTTSIVEFLQLRRDDRMLVMLPFSYCYGASLLHTHLAVGASLRICETQAFPETIVEAIEADHCTGVAGVPSSYQLLLRASSFETRQLPTLRLMQQAGGRLPHSQVTRLVTAQPQARLFVMYGQTEATARLAYLPPDRIMRKPGSVGMAIPGVHLRVCDESGADLPIGEVGEIRARGGNVTHGYWEDPEGTAAKYTDGELRTGDLGRMDEDGFLYVVDRRADFIKSWGIRVSSHEIEDAALEHEAISATAAVGRPDPDAGEAIVLFVVTHPDSKIDDTEIQRYLRRRLAKHLVPHEIRLVPQLPLNENGKVVKTALRELALTSVMSTSN